MHYAPILSLHLPHECRPQTTSCFWEIGHLSFGPVLSQWENFDTSTNETKTSCYFICITIKQLYLVSIFPLSAIYVPLPGSEKSAILTSKFQFCAHNSWTFIHKTSILDSFYAYSWSLFSHHQLKMKACWIAKVKACRLQASWFRGRRWSWIICFSA